MTINGKVSEEHIDPYSTNLDLDILIVGAGFSGIYFLYQLRKKGYNVKIFDVANGLGGTWKVNHYPGARVDSSVPIYEFSIPEIWKGWNWSQRYPDWKELQAYFEYCDSIMDIKKDVAFNTKVIEAHFDKTEGKWLIKTDDGRITKAKYFLPCIGFAAKEYVPDFPGLETFKGEIHHSSNWPESEVDVKGKKCAVIGTGATGVQIIQEWAKVSKSLIVFQRTPNLCIPMGQKRLTPKDQEKEKYPEIFHCRLVGVGGMTFKPIPKDTFEDSEEEREKNFEKLWAAGDFSFWVGGYKDCFTNWNANKIAYDFWAKKIRALITDEKKKDILAPLEPPHPFGVKRPSLFVDYYEQLNKPNVEIVSVKNNPIIEVKPEGIVTADGKLYEIDVLALATGFDAITGGFKKLGLSDINGEKLIKQWENGTKTFLGISISGYPNMFFTYGPQAPTAFSNGPTLIEIQADWIIKVIDYCESNGIKYIDAKEEEQEKWAKEITAIANATLFPLADSWYMGANIPGKPKEMLNFLGGVPKYSEILQYVLENNFEGFKLVK
uniref:Flavin-containing monooxygenase n=1 Tax=Panagrolaimus sp. PS1159 TaxID=55785 RepID=A0AC35F280_9BILA